MRVAIITDWLVAYAGGEKVLEQILKIYPQADLYSLVDFFPKEHRKALSGKYAYTSFIQKLPFAKTKYRQYLPLMPLAIEQFDLSSYDLVISSSSAIAKGVITGPDQLHLCYCHSPIRYAWDLQHQYLAESNLLKGFKSWLIRYSLHKIRQWDVRTANGVDNFISNSHFIKRRIWKVYRRKAQVVYPPVDINLFTLSQEKEDFYLTSSRIVPYKKIHLIVEAFAKMPDKQLIIIGDGPDFNKVKKSASKNVSMLGYQPFEILLNYLQRAKAFLFSSLEDFGIAPVEAQACGTPVIAYGKGGVLETIHGLESPTPTGVFFQEQSVSSITEAINTFEERQNIFSPTICRNNALRFSNERFCNEFKHLVKNILSKHHSPITL